MSFFSTKAVEELGSAKLYGENLYPILRKNEIGFIDINGEIVIEPKYMDIIFDEEGMIAFQDPQSRRWGYMNEKLEIIVDPTLNTMSPEKFSCGLAVFNNDTRDKYGYIDKLGNVVIQPKFTRAASFLGSYAVVSETAAMKKSYWDWAGSAKDIYGVIDKTGAYVIVPEYDYLDCCNEEIMIAEKNDLYGMIDIQNNIIIPFTYEGLSKTGFNEGEFYAKFNGKWGIIDKYNKIIIDFKIEDICDEYFGIRNIGWSKRIYATNDVNSYFYDGKWCLINNLGEKVRDLNEYIYVSEFIDSFATARTHNNEIQLINKNGEVIYSTNYEYCPEKFGQFSEGLCEVYDSNNKYGYINKMGEVVIPFKFDWACPFSKGVARAGINGNDDKSYCGIINGNGDFIVEPKYDYIYDFVNGLALFREGKYPKEVYGYINTKGEIVYAASQFEKSPSKKINKIGEENRIKKTEDFYLEGLLGSEDDETDLDEVIYKCIEENKLGNFKDSMELLESFLKKKDIINSEIEYKNRFTALYLYIEALIYTDAISKAQEFHKELSKVFGDWGNNYGYEKEPGLYSQLVNARMRYHTKDESYVRSILFDLIKEVKSNDFIKSMSNFYLAQIEFEENNLIDATKYVSLANNYFGAGFYREKLLELQRQIDLKKASISTTELRRKYKSFKQFGDENDCVASTLCLNHNGSLAAVLYGDGILKIWDIINEKAVICFEDYKKDLKSSMHNGGLYDYKSITFSPDSKLVAVGLEQGKIMVFDLESKKLNFSYSLFPENYNACGREYGFYYEYTYIEFSQSGKYLIAVPAAYESDPEQISKIKNWEVPEHLRKIFLLNHEEKRIVFEYAFEDKKKEIDFVGFDEKENIFVVAMYGQLIAWNLKKFVQVYSDNDYEGTCNGKKSIVFCTEPLAFIYPISDRRIKVVKYTYNNDVFDFSYNIITNENKEQSIKALTVDMEQRKLIAMVSCSCGNCESYLRIWNMSDFREVKSIKMKTGNVDEIIINKSLDELWLFNGRYIEIIQYSIFQSIKEINLNDWGSNVSTFSRIPCKSKNGEHIAIDYENFVRFY